MKLRQFGVLTIIPLGRDSSHGSSSLPEGSQLPRLAPQQQESAWGGLIEPGRLSPPIWPCTTRGFPCLVCLHTSGGLLPHRFTLTAESAFADVLQVSLLDATVLHYTGGLFSVALSVNRTARMTCAAAPLTLSGALP